MKNKTQHIIILLLLLLGAVNLGYAQENTKVNKVKIYGNVYGGGKLSQVVAKDDALDNQLVTDSKLNNEKGGLFHKDTEHSYTTYVKLGTGAEIFGKVFGGGQGKEGDDEEVAGLVTGQTDVVLDGASTWERIFGGGEMADVSGNTLVHFKKGKMAHDAFGGGLGMLTTNKENGEVLPDNRQAVLASADIKKITGKESTTGNTFVVFDGEDDNHTEYEYKILKTYEVKDGVVSETELKQLDVNRETQLFLTDHNIYGGGMTAADVAGNTYTHINYGMVSADMLKDEQWDIVYNSIANAQFCVFGGGYGYHAQVNGNTNVTMDIEGSNEFKYLSQFRSSFNSFWGGVNPDPTVIYDAAEKATWSHGAPGRSCMDIVGGGYNGKVVGNTNVTIGGDVVVRKVYGGGYYASVNETNVTIKSGLFNRIYGGGLIGNVYNKANLTIGQHGTSQDIKTHNGQLLVKDAIYGGNDISGTVGTSDAINHTNDAGITYHVYDPVDANNKGVRMNIYGGLVLGDVYGAGNGNHTGYGNPDYMEFNHSQHPSENYRTLAHAGENGTTHVYKYRPRTARVEMNLQGNDGKDFNDASTVDKVRIWGRTFGGGNSCNVGVWNGQEDDNEEVYAENGSWHPGDNFTGGGTIQINIGSHVQFGNRNDSHTTPNGLFMGSNGEHMITQHLDPEKARYYHQYWDSKAKKYYPGFVVYEDDANTPIKRSVGLKAFKAFINNILTKSDNVHLNIENNAEDVWMSNFVGGGYRGSMQANSENGSFYYKLPKGVTIGHSVVGGAFNAHIIYRVYATEYGKGVYRLDSNGNYLYETVEPGQGVISKAEAEKQGLAEYDYIKKLYEEGHEGEEEYKTGYLRYNFDGGMLAMNSGMNAEDNASNTRIHQIHAPSSLTTADFTCSGGYFDNKEKALVRLELKNRLQPAVHEANPTAGTELNVHGGIVYGGCYLTGYVEGDSWVDYDCSLSPLCTDERFFGKRNKAIYDEVADLNRNNALNIFGAGYGVDTHSTGDVYVCVKTSGGDTSSENGDWPFIYNVFGGSNMGTVGGSTNVYYDGGKQGTMLGSLYGGGFKGDIEGNTYVELVQGFLVNVYGGSRQANIGGASHVWAYDGSTRPSTGLTPGTYNHLIICNMYGGNDISGIISGTMPATWTKKEWKNLEGIGFNSYIQVSGTNPGEKGFPLVGNIYGGGNGELWSEELGVAPNVGTSLLEIDGGTTLNAFGGGNKATITGDAYIFVNASGDKYADVQFTEYQKGILEDKFFKTVRTGYTWNGTELQMSAHHVDNLFGGNNVATMDIQPKWNLKSGKIGNVYSGGNMGDMTYYNPNADTANGETKGLSIEVNSDDINIESLYGGCRMSDVKAMVDATTPAAFGENEYGATVNIKKGHIGNVYGGNDISGYVYNGTNVNLSGSITGNVYGAGNGNYLYAYDKKGEHVTSGIAEVWNNDVNEYVYWIPGNADATPDATPLQQLLALNKVRPHVSKAYLNIQGSNAAAGEKVYIPGSVYCGGNASTIRPMTDDDEDAHVKFNIGDNVIVNEVFMGSNGESLKYDANGKSNYIVNFEKVNAGLNLATDLMDSDWSVLNNGNVSNADKELMSMDADLRNKLYPNLLSVYMRAVDMKAMPQGFDIGKDDEGNEKTFTNTWIGTFCMGGNAGSMMTDQPVDIVFPQSLNFFGRIIGGSKDASFLYKGKWHRGGFRMPLADGATLKDDNGASQPTKTKLRMKIRGDWYSRRMVLDEEYEAYRETYKAQDYLAPDKTDDGVNWNVNGKAWHDGCNVYGGCYQSGDMVGDVQIYIESDMLAYSRYLKDTQGATIDDYREPSLDESNKLNLPVANVYGAGYGPESRSFGDAYIYMKDIPNVDKDTHPSVNNIFGGGRNGMLVGNTVIHVHDGLVYKDVVGGCFAAPLYGSSQVTIGYPKFYVCKKSGEYFLDRADKWNTGYQTKGNNRMDDVVKQSIKYFEGDYVPCNVYDLIKSVKLASGTTDDLASIHTGTRAGNDYFDYFDESNSYLPQGGWDNVEVRVRGGVYGGGFSLSNSTAAVAGSYTTLACTEAYNQGTDSKNNSSVGYGGNSSIIISDRGEVKNHIRISTETTKSVSNSNGKVEYTANGGVYGDGRLVFCEGFRTAELNNYGYADSDPLMLNTLQRMDLLTINDCNFKLYGDQDFATDQLDARNYSLARIGELRMNSSIPADKDLPEDKRNYIAFYNNIHYLGAIVTNDDFHNGKFHDPDGKVGTETYRQNKQSYIDRYHDKTDATSVAQFKLRNYATARNMLGINSGYCLRVENQYYNGEEKAIYYGPVVGVAEVKLLNVRQGEGGGYVYADNIHADVYDPEHPETATFMNESGNFVFQGVVRQGETEKQFIIDDCLPIGFDEWKAGRAVASELPEQHYWYVIGDTYYYNTTLTAYTYNNTKTFDLTNSDPNVIFAGIENGDDVILESVKWLPADYSGDYSSDIRGGRDNALTSLKGSDAKYQFLVQVGDNAWSQEMPRSPYDDEAVSQDNKPHALYNASAGSPRFNVHLLDNVNNSPEGEEDGYYNSHLSVPEHVQLIVKAKHKDGKDNSGNDVYSYKTYNVTLEIIYLQGPSFTGNVKLENCALPGEYIAFSSDGIKVKTTQQLPLTGYSWKLVPQKSGSDNEWDIEKAVTIPADYYKISLNGDVEGSIPALYGQNKWNIFYTFNAGGETFTVEPKKDESADLHERMLVVHNYHKMADINDQNFNVTLSNVDGDNIFSKVLADGAKIYIADDEDLKAFGNYINAGNTGKGMDFYLQDNLALPINWKINSTFAGTLHGDGYVLNAADNQSFLGALSETAKVYNLGVVGKGARIASDGAGVVNCFVASDAAEMKYGKTAFELSHYHNATDNPDYVHEYYSGDDWRYARTAREDIGSHGYLRTATPYYGNKNTAHNMEHNDEAYIPVEHDYLFFGQSLNPNGSKQPEHIDNDEANRVFAGEGYFNSKVDNGFYYNKSAAWAMQEGLTAVRFDADNVPASIGVVEEGITRNLLVYGADDATVAAASAAFFHIKGSEGNYSCDDLSLVDSQDFNAPFAFTATKASYERTPANFVVKRGTAWEALCLPFAPTAVKALKGDEEKAITHFHGAANTDNIDGTAGDADADNIGHDYWLRELTGSDTATDGGLVAKFSRPAAAEYVAYRPYIVSFPGETFYEYDLSGSTIRWEAENAAIGVTDDATTSKSADKITYNGAFRNVDNGYVLNGDGDAFVDGNTNAFRGYITLASTQAKRLIRIGSDYDDLLYNEQVPNEPIIDIHGNSSEVFNIKVKGHEVYVTSSENVSYPCNTVTGASIGTWVIPAGKSRFTISASGIYIINGIKFVIK